MRLLGSDLRIVRWSYLFAGDGLEEIINPQPKGGMAKAYQVKQVRELVTRHQLGVDADD